MSIGINNIFLQIVKIGFDKKKIQFIFELLMEVVL